MTAFFQSRSLAAGPFFTVTLGSLISAPCNCLQQIAAICWTRVQAQPGSPRAGAAGGIRKLTVIAAALCLLVPVVAHAQAPSYDDLMRQASQAAANQEIAPALLAYAAALPAAQDQGQTSAAQTDMLKVIGDQGMPHQLDASQLHALEAAGPLSPLNIKHVDSAATGGSVTLIGIDGRGFSNLSTLSDPENQWPFPALVAAYTPGAGDPTKSVLVCSVHYQIQDDQEFAGRVGRLLVLLRSALMRRTGQVPALESPFNVWLARGDATTPGGEQWRNNVYLYDVGDGRSSIEWIREIAHEYGHLAIPPVGGDYTSPEAWANGYIGERLMVRWLADPDLAGAGAVEQDWGRTFSGYPNFKRILIDPALQTFEQHGLSRSMLARRDETGMRYVIGLLLYIDQAKGGEALGSLLWNLDDPKPDALYDPAKKLGVPTEPITGR